MKLFGFEFNKKQQIDNSAQTQLRLPIEESDGTTVVSSSGSSFAYSMGIDPTWKTEAEMIQYYRDMAQTHTVDKAIDEIVSDAIVTDGSQPVKIDFEDDSKISDKIKDRISEEFDGVLKLLDFRNEGHVQFRDWYVDSRIAYYKVVDPDNTKLGIQSLQKLDVISLKKVKEVATKKNDRDVDVIVGENDYFVYSSSIDNPYSNNQIVKKEMRINPEAIAYCTSGLVDKRKNWVQSYLHKAIRPYNHLRLLEDASLIYKLVRAPQRRVFYIDVGNLPRARAEEYMRDIMNQYRNKITYNATTGDVQDDRRAMAMLEDYWLARKDGCFSLDTKIKLLDGRDVELGQLIVEYKLGKVNWVYSVAPDGSVVPGLISWAGVTRNDTEVLDVYLDNGEIITATPDHKFILRNGVRIEAQDLEPGSSLMPLNISTKVIGSTRYKKEYEVIQHNNESENFEFTHRMVSEFMVGRTPNGSVIHHCDMNRFNNNPENLLVMGRTEHLKLHSTMSSLAWQLGDRETHIKNMSIAATEFYQTARGMERRQEISDFNKSCEAIWNGLVKGREVMHANRDADKLVMTDEEFIEKWCPGLGIMIEGQLGTVASKDRRESDKLSLSPEDYDKKWNSAAHRRALDLETMSEEEFNAKWNSNAFSKEDSMKGSLAAAAKMKLDKETMSPEDYRKKYESRWAHVAKNTAVRYSDIEFSVVMDLIHSAVKLNPRITNSKLKDVLSQKYEYLNTVTKAEYFIGMYGYGSFTDLIVRTMSAEFISERRMNNAKQTNNHKVVKVVRRTDSIDVGTLTIDGDHVYHDYHNFALSSGVFVMNSHGTEIQNLTGDVNQTIDDLEYFKKNLYDALNIPLGRLEPNVGFSLGRASEITRDELRMSSNVNKLRNRFSGIFSDILRTQLILKGVIAAQEWEDISHDIQFVFESNVLFAEMKSSEILQQRLGNLGNIENYIGKYFSQRWVQKNVLYLTDEEIDRQREEIEEEIKLGYYKDPRVTDDQSPSEQPSSDDTEQSDDETEPQLPASL